MRKTLRNHQEVCHLWANQTQPEGRSGNMSFEGDTLFSYHHWWIGRILHTSHGTVALLRSDTYSVSTSKHQSYAARAASHHTCFRVPTKGNSREEHQANVQYFISQRDALRQKAARARQRKEVYLEQQAQAVEDCREYLKIFADEVGLPFIYDIQAILNDEEGRTLEALRQELERTRAQREAEQQARRIEREQEDLLRWRNGEDLSRYFHTTALRLSANGTQVETSHGASVPLDAARVLWVAYRAGKAIEGRHIGPFTINRVNGETLTIGCHTIPIQEVEHVLGS